ncbi:hypothetical protein CERSUDRAFT_121307 [Gelatoporia subvermispora B]|uniref:FAD-binding domain-containing protein n=1 Tax=Ceriporiopsis subvermispora (strain B) TaxID=914234 RepID=M2QU53_CERS8|nr:hypothetical protein CERSUDRAFT_121307 [Gelatoporia subvermispora B]
MALPASTNILIVGCGPAGLSCAITLAAKGHKDITIIDARPDGRTLSRAIVIHAQTIEALHSVGVADKLNARGVRAKRMVVRWQQTRLIKANFATLEERTRFPWALLISQSDTEDILEERLNELGIHILRPYKVTDMESVQGGIMVKFESGESIKARYVVGADGNRSTVRTLAGIPFRDPKTGKNPHAAVVKPTDSAKKLEKKLGKELVVADVHLSGHIPPTVNPTDLGVFLSPMQFLLLVPLPPAKDDPEQRPIYRMSCPVEPGAKEVTLTYLQKVLNSALGLPTEKTPIVDKLRWASLFRVKSAVADRFHQRMGDGIVTLCGDAGHVHSPAGGQGMNLGIRDAIQLGQALSDIIKRDNDPNTSPSAARAYADKRLEGYTTERRKLAVGVIKITKFMTWATGLEAPPAQRARNALYWTIGRGSVVSKKFTLRLSGLEAADHESIPLNA